MQNLKRKNTSEQEPELDKKQALKKKASDVTTKPLKPTVEKNISKIKKKPGEENVVKNASQKSLKKKTIGILRRPKSEGNLKNKKNVSYQQNKGDHKNGKAAQTEKPVWSEMKKQKKELRLQRRKTKATAPLFEISYKAKGLATQIQRKATSAAVREKLCQELHALLAGQYPALALAHDLSRVIQVLLKHSAQAVRSDISAELMPIMPQMMQSKYAHHSVKRILKYGTDEIRSKLIDKLQGNILSLATHTISAPLLDFAYSEHASTRQKLLMQQEFYGEMYKNSKDLNVKCLSDTYKSSPEMKQAILSTCKASIQRILDKNLHDGELLHAVLHQYMLECTPEEQSELITTLSPLIVPLSNSLPGVNTACMCVWRGTNKDKKAILKVVKEHALALSTHKTGYRLLIAIFDSVDDTVLVKKAILSTLSKHVRTIAQDHWGRMVLHWLVKPCDPAAFHPSFVKQLRDGASYGSSKKNPEIRASELRDAIMPAIHTDIIADPKFWMGEPSMALLTVTILMIEKSQEVMSAVTSIVCQPNWTIQNNGKDVVGIEDAGMHMCLKKIALKDKDSVDVTFGGTLCEQLTDETLKQWLVTNRGCFLLWKVLKNNTPEVNKKLVDKLRVHSKLLEKQSTPGAKILSKLMTEYL